MAAPEPQWYNSADTALLTGLAFSGVVPGTPSTAQTIHLWNQKGGSTAEALRNLRLIVMARLSGETAYLSAGRPYLDDRWVQARVVGGSGVTPPQGSWTPLGAGATLELPELAANRAVYLEVRLYPPLSYQDAAADVEILLQLSSSPAVALGEGHSGVRSDGVLSGLGDGLYTALLIAGNVTEQSPVAAGVIVPYAAGIAAGRPWAQAEESVALSNLDGSGAALASGEAYRALISNDAAGAVVVTKGAKSSASPATPALPAGHVARALVLREFDGLVHDADIDQEVTLGRYLLVSTSGLLATLAPGTALVDGALVRHTHEQQATLASSTCRLWLTRAGALSVTTTSTPPETRALLLWELVTDGSGVTASRDRRRLLHAVTGRPLELMLAGTLVDEAVSGPVVPDPYREYFLDPERPAVFALGANGGTSGSTRADVEYSAAGGAWTSIYASGGTVPELAFDAADPVDSTSRPTTLVLPAGCRVRARVDQIPGGGAPTAAVVALEGGS